MLDFYLIKDSESEPEFHDENLQYVGSLNLESFQINMITIRILGRQPRF